MYKIYLKEEDMLDETHFPVIALLNEAANENLIAFLDNLYQGTGSGYNYSDCCFWEELDEYDRERTDKFDGIFVETESGEDLIISYTDMVTYLKLLKQLYIADHPDSEQQISHAISMFCKKYLIDKTLKKAC